ncbi:NAD(P)H-binding protein [Nocardioides sp. NBC_00850]|uniref:NAD(P)H-binding protein n=1 Tax=Nocardioides sp. NBC_00850 TaxID=2976001 RepID=UPI00387012F8|nr:NAD(P)H-binding protein [Nocardioides sp. NBC_00850]
MRIAIAGVSGLVGSALAKAAQAAGHEVVGLSKESGTDVLQPAGLADALAGAEALVDVVQSPSLDEEGATAFFTAAATNLGAAAHEAGVRRTVVLSIIGVDKIAESDTEAGTGFDGYYRAKYAQELACVAHAPGPHVVRSAQFHDIARQAIGWGRDGDRTTVPDLVTQPVAVDAMVEVLLAVATGEIEGDLVEVAGPRRETLARLSAAYAERAGDPVQVDGAPVGELVRDGVLLPGEDGHLVGPSFDQWLEATVTVPARRP